MARAFHSGWEYLKIVIAAVAAVIIGTLLHRSGAAQNLPWGLTLAFALVGAGSAISIRRKGVMGAAVYMLVSTLLVWSFAMYMGPGGDVLIAGRSEAFTTYFSKNAGLLWLYGVMVVQILVIVASAVVSRVRRARGQLEQKNPDAQEQASSEESASC